MNISKAAYGLIILIAIVLILVYIKDIIIPFILALIIWFIIREVQRLIARLKIRGRSLPAWIRGLLSFAIIFGALGLLVNLLAINIQGISKVLPSYEKNLNVVRESIDESLGIDMMAQLRDISGDFDFANIVSSLLNSLTTLIGNAFLIIIYVAFLMLEQRFFRKKFNALYQDDEKQERANRILESIDESLSKYVNLKTVISITTGAMSYIALSIIGVDFAFFWAFLIFVLNYIPTIGSLIATLFPAIIASVQFGGLEQSLYVIIAVGSIQVIVGNVIEPRVMGNSLNISSLVVILSLAFWGSIWGVVGMILSVPIMVMLVITFAQFKETRSLAVLLSDKGILID
ncbi:MAG: AI-2E family transporter [Flavobacteriales bacterium]|nr:AI-2E family transporter [Flavobacteriales bacterium]